MSSKKHRKRRDRSRGQVPQPSPRLRPEATRTARPGPASLSRRFFAYLIDWYLGALCTMIPISVISQWQTGDMTNLNLLDIPAPWGLVAGATGTLLGATYYVAFPILVWKGQTPGKHLCSIAIANPDGTTLSTRQLLLRQIVGLIVIDGTLVSASSIWHQMLTIATRINFVTPLMYVGFALSAISVLMIILRQDRRCIHDFLAGTEVISKPRIHSKIETD